MAKTIFITGASRGFGKIWSEAFLDRGDNVVITSRNVDGLKPLADKFGSRVLALGLDITNRAACFEAIEQAKAHFGTIDVVINNAAMSVQGAVEELAEQDVKTIIDANLLGTLWVTQAVLPVFRKQGSGHIIQLSSALGIYSFATVGMYSATKFAVEGLSEALAQEVKKMGIHVTILEPNGYATEFSSSSVQSKAIAAYDDVKAELYANPALSDSDVYGDPGATAKAVLQLVDSNEPPLRLILGKKALPLTRALYEERLATWKKWEEVSIAAHGI